MQTTIEQEAQAFIDEKLDNAIYYYGEYRYYKAAKLMEEAHGAYIKAGEYYREAKLACAIYNRPMPSLMTLAYMEF